MFAMNLQNNRRSFLATLGVLGFGSTLLPEPLPAPWIVAFSYGLMHGLGFAGGLSEAGLPVGHIPTALLFFSLGVEAGHFLFIGVVLAMIRLWNLTTAHWSLKVPRWAELIPPYAIGSIAVFWFIQRIGAI